MSNCSSFTNVIAYTQLTILKKVQSAVFFSLSIIYKIHGSINSTKPPMLKVDRINIYLNFLSYLMSLLLTKLLLVVIMYESIIMFSKTHSAEIS